MRDGEEEEAAKESWADLVKILIFFAGLFSGYIIWGCS